MAYTEEEEVAGEVDDTPAFVGEGTEEDDVVIEGEDVSQAQAMGGGDFLDPKDFPGGLKGIVFEIKKAVIDTYTPKGEDDWQKRSLAITLAVGPQGLDGKGKYKNKHFFPRILIAVNREAYDFTKNAAGKESDFYAPKTGSAWGEYNEFLKALGFSTAPAPTNNKAFRDSLVGRFIAYDITAEKKQALDRETGKYKTIDERENKLRNAKAVKAKAVAEAAEAAAE